MLQEWIFGDSPNHLTSQHIHKTLNIEDRLTENMELLYNTYWHGAEDGKGLQA